MFCVSLNDTIEATCYIVATKAYVVETSCNQYYCLIDSAMYTLIFASCVSLQLGATPVNH